MIITISGTPGSGKSTVAKILVQKLNAERIYVGGIRRELARKKGMTLEDLNEYAKTHPETDVDVDKEAAAKARELDHDGKIIIDEGYTQYYFVPESLKVFIKVNWEEGARRIWKDLQQKDTKQARNEGNVTSFQQMKQRVLARLEEDSARFRKYYGVDYLDESQYDLILDSTHFTAVQIAEKVIEFIKKNEKTYKEILEKRAI